MSFNPLSSLSYTTSAVSSGLSGTIPPEISYLQDLITLDLNDNDIGGVIPNAFGDLLQLETIFLHDNDIVGDGIGDTFWTDQLEYSPDTYGNTSVVDAMPLW